jgi:Ribonuclease G/E
MSVKDKIAKLEKEIFKINNLVFEDFEFDIDEDRYTKEQENKISEILDFHIETVEKCNNSNEDRHKLKDNLLEKLERLEDVLQTLKSAQAEIDEKDEELRSRPTHQDIKELIHKGYRDLADENIKLRSENDKYIKDYRKLVLKNGQLEKEKADIFKEMNKDHLKDLIECSKVNPVKDWVWINAKIERMTKELNSLTAGGEE